MLFESAKARRIRELEAENEYLRTQVSKQRERLEVANAGLEKAVKVLNERNGELRRSVFAEKIGLLPCESPACEFCKNAVWYGDTDGRHIAGCKKGIKCADFEEREEKKETSAPMPANVLAPYPVGIPGISPYYPVSAALGCAGGFR